MLSNELRRVVVENVYDDFQNITGYRPDAVFNDQGEFKDGVIQASAPRIKDWVKEVFGFWDDEIYYMLDDKLLFTRQ